MVSGSDLRRNVSPTKSCGCLAISTAKKRLTKHGYTCKDASTGKRNHNSTYSIWCGMKGRCNNLKHPRYIYYGGRGIKVCDRWLNSFNNFLQDMGTCPKGYSIERKDVNGNYEPDNCRWATRSEQANNKRTSVKLTFNGETKTVAKWAEFLNIKRITIVNRLLLGWTIENVLTRKVKIYKKD